MSEPARLAGVLFGPKEAYADIVARPQRWWIPLLLVIVANLTYMYLFSSRVGWDKMIRESMQNNSRIEQLSPEQKEQAVQQAMKFAGISAYAGAVLAVPVVTLIMAGALMFVMNAMGGKASFKQSFTIVSYSAMIGLVVLVLSIAVMYLKNPEDFDLKNPLAFNAGAFVASTAPKWLASLASSFDLFTFWSMGVLATGFAATSRKLPWSKALTGIIMLWAVWVVAKTGWVAMFS